MSDFLGRLVARSLDGTSAPGAASVRPLLPSRFEPLAPEAMPDWGETVVETTAPPPPPAHRVEAAPQVSRAETRRAAEDPRPAPRPPLPSPSHPPAEEGRRREAPVREPSFLSSPGRREGDGRVGSEGLPSGTRTLASIPPPQSPVLGGGAPSPGERGDGRWERGSGGEVSPRDPLHTLPAPPSPPTPAEPRHRVEPVVRRIEVERLLVPGPVPPAAPRPEAAPVFRSAPPTSSEPALPVLRPQVPTVERDPFPVRREAPAPETVIQVTIGRVEVKATPAPKAPARERAAARTAVDLDEYLKQRARGER